MHWDCSISIPQYIKTINQVGVKYEQQLVVYSSQSQVSRSHNFSEQHETVILSTELVNNNH